MGRLGRNCWGRSANSGSAAAEADRSRPADGPPARRHGAECGRGGGPRVRAELATAQEFGAAVHVSSATLAEVLRGHPRDARVHALLQSLEQHPVSSELGRAAGELLGQTGRADTIDAIVAVTAQAAAGRMRLLTGDPVDLRALTARMATVTVAPI